MLSSFERLAHAQRDRSGHQQHIGVPGRSDKAKAEPLEIVEGVAERVVLEFAAIARASVDVADGEAPPERPAAPISPMRRASRVPGRRSRGVFG
jgi:hypothetical protein